MMLSLVKNLFSAASILFFATLFMCQQPALDLQTAGNSLHKSAQAIAGHYPVAGIKQRQRVGAASIGNGTRTRLYGSGQLAIGTCFTDRNFTHGSPYALLKRRTTARRYRLPDHMRIFQVGCNLVSGRTGTRIRSGLQR